MGFVKNEEDLQKFTAELKLMLEMNGIDLEIMQMELAEDTIRYFMRLNTLSQYGKVFKVPNLIYYNLDVEGSDIYDGSGTYEEWLLVVPNK